MGLVVTTNSATLVNKGLEVIEAHLLFDVEYDRIDVVVHPQSIVHSMVEFIDGSTIAQASPPDMRLPISLGLDWPNRVAAVGRPLDWTTATSWTFEPLDATAFPAVALAKQVGRAGGEYPAVFNAANEEAVAAFHAGRIGFLDIVDTVRAVVESHEASAGELTVASLAEAERTAGVPANERIGARLELSGCRGRRCRRHPFSQPNDSGREGSRSTLTRWIPCSPSSSASSSSWSASPCRSACTRSGTSCPRSSSASRSPST